MKNKELHEEIQELGWGEPFWGAEGVYLHKPPFRLQIISQGESELTRSVINLNHHLSGLQNLHIFHVYEGNRFQPMKQRQQTAEFFTMFYGFCDSIEEFKSICKHLRIDSLKPEEDNDE